MITISGYSQTKLVIIEKMKMKLKLRNGETFPGSSHCSSFLIWAWLGPSFNNSIVSPPRQETHKSLNLSFTTHSLACSKYKYFYSPGLSVDTLLAEASSIILTYCCITKINWISASSDRCLITIKRTIIFETFTSTTFTKFKPIFVRLMNSKMSSLIWEMGD